MENFMENLKNIREILKKDYSYISISTLSEVSGVSTRQLRYWEQKGFITTHTKSENSHRQYSMSMAGKVILIKGFLDEGFTLTKAAEKAAEQMYLYDSTNSMLSNLVDQFEFVNNRYTVVHVDNHIQHGEQAVLIFDRELDKLSYLPSKAYESLDLDSDS
ncbi:MAG: MerR family transcriptional regulator [Enterococcus sp.]